MMTRHMPFFVALAIMLAGANALADGPADQSADLEALIREAQEMHPSVAAAKEFQAGLQEVPSQVGSLPDPVLVTSAQNLRIDDFGLDGHPMTGLLFGLNQGVPFPGKLPRRRRAAERAAEVAGQQVLAVKTALELRVRERYWALHYAERAEVLVGESEQALNLLTDVVHVRYSVGQGAQQDALQAQVAHSRLRAHLQQLKQSTISARRALNAAVGRAPSENLASTTDTPPIGPLLDRASLAKQALRQNPELRVGNASVDAALAAVQAAHRDRLPDFAVGLGYRARLAAPGDMSNGADMVSLTVSVSLPVWAGSKQNARTRQVRREVSTRRAQTAALAVDVQDAVARTVDEVERLTEQIALYRKELLPESDQALDASIADYQVGRVQFVSVLQNWRAQLDVRLELERLLTDRASRVARLRALCGGVVERNVR